MLWVPEIRTASLFLTLEIPPLSSIEQSVEECYADLYGSSKEDLMEDWRNDFCNNLCDPKVECRAQ
jgi:hypothetical protein